MKRNDALELAAKTAKEAEVAAAKSRIETKVSLAITNGQIIASQKEEMVNLGLASENALDTLISAMPVKKNFAAGLTTPSGNGASEVKSMDDFEKLSHEAKLAFKADKPEEYKKLFN